MANFWQDVREDYARGRIYIPKNDMEVFRVSEEQIAEGIATPEFRGLMRCEVDHARALFEQGLPLIGKVHRDLALDLDLFSRGGLEILRAIERQGYDVLSARPAISKSRKLALLLRAVSGKLLPFLRLGKPKLRNGVTQANPSDGLTLDRAYAACRAIARREAKNFYYAFVALPEPRRNAICAIYAFMRQADDLADDESLSRDERRRHLEAWLAEWRGVCQGGIYGRSGFSCRARLHRALPDSALSAG